MFTFSSSLYLTKNTNTPLKFRASYHSGIAVDIPVGVDFDYMYNYHGQSAARGTRFWSLQYLYVLRMYD